VRRPDDGPGAFAWFFGFVAVLLPWAGGAFGLAGIWHIARQEPGGWWYLAAGCASVATGFLIDLLRAHPSVRESSEPDLNRRHDQLVGRIVVVEEAISRGRGKVRVGDTLWPAEGPDTPAGEDVQVTATRGMVLVVERAAGPGQSGGRRNGIG
jgi:membrane protein implicated in regulation of membrane protease activity